MLGVQANFRHPRRSHPHVEGFDPDAGFAHFHADNAAKLGVDLEQHPWSAAVGLLQADFGDKAFLEQRRRHVRHAAAAEAG